MMLYLNSIHMNVIATHDTVFHLVKKNRRLELTEAFSLSQIEKELRNSFIVSLEDGRYAKL